VAANQLLQVPGLLFIEDAIGHLEVMTKKQMAKSPGRDAAYIIGGRTKKCGGGGMIFYCTGSDGFIEHYHLDSGNELLYISSSHKISFEHWNDQIANMKNINRNDLLNALKNTNTYISSLNSSCNDVLYKVVIDYKRNECGV